jgi:hypothetical protein
MKLRDRPSPRIRNCSSPRAEPRYRLFVFFGGAVLGGA